MQSAVLDTSLSPDYFKLIGNPVKFRLFLLKNLPAALFSGVKLKSANPSRTEITIPYKWFTRNPFRSTYFACLSMAAEMSTGILALSCVHNRRPSISPLVVAVEGKFFKKATGITSFICEQGNEIRNVVEEAASSGNSQSIRVLSSGYNERNELVAEFYITWSFKRRERQS
jgi:hypothetical protein